MMARRNRRQSVVVLTLATLIAAPTCNEPAGAQSSSAPVKAGDAGAALERGDLDQAVLLYNAALDDHAISNDRRAVLLTERGAALMKRRNFKAALDDFNKAAGVYPEYAAVYVNRGNLLLLMGQGTESINEAIKDFDRAIVLAPSLAAAYGNRGAARLKLGEAVPGIADFTHAISLQPQNPAALNGRGLARLAIGQVGAAIRDYSRAVSVNPGFAQGYRNRAAASMRLGRAGDAVEDISRALAFDARRVDDYIARGEAYLAANNTSAAVTDFAKAIELDPKSVAGHIGLGYADATSNTFDDAVAELSRAIELEPRSARAYAVRAWTYIKSQQSDLGEKDVERALRLEPVTADAYWAQGELKEAMGDRDAATGAYARALGLDIRHRETLAALVRLGLEPQQQTGVVANAGVDGWTVNVSGGTQFTATTPQFPALHADLEMMGDGQPRIIAWERQKSPYAGYGLLRYGAGTLPTAQGPEIVECTAIIDLSNGKVIGAPVAKLGARAATFSWGENSLAVTGADGLAETIQLGDRHERHETADASPAVKRSDAGGSGGSRDDGDRGQSSQRDSSARQASRQRKPKSLFDLIFGN